MCVKITRAEKSSERFQEVLTKEQELGATYRTAIKNARKRLADEEGYPNRRT